MCSQLVYTLNSFSSNLTHFDREGFYSHHQRIAFLIFRFCVCFCLCLKWGFCRGIHAFPVCKQVSNNSQTTFSSRKLTFILKQLCSSTSCCHFSFVCWVFFPILYIDIFAISFTFQCLDSCCLDYGKSNDVSNHFLQHSFVKIMCTGTWWS